MMLQLSRHRLWPLTHSGIRNGAKIPAPAKHAANCRSQSFVHADVGTTAGVAAAPILPGQLAGVSSNTAGVASNTAVAWNPGSLMSTSVRQRRPAGGNCQAPDRVGAQVDA